MCSHHWSRAPAAGFPIFKLPREILGFPSQCSRGKSHHVFLWRIWRKKKNFLPKVSINLCCPGFPQHNILLAFLKFEIKVCCVPALGVNSMPKDHKQNQGGDEGLLATPQRRSKASGVQVCHPSSPALQQTAPFSLCLAMICNPRTYSHHKIIRSGINGNIFTQINNTMHYTGSSYCLTLTRMSHCHR